jgi:hypothetical protein
MQAVMYRHFMVVLLVEWNIVHSFSNLPRRLHQYWATTDISLGNMYSEPRNESFFGDQ